MRSVILVCLFLAAAGYCKQYTRCELARALKSRYNLEAKYLASMVCIASRESNYNTSKQGPPNSNKSRDNGLFQINDRYWCTNKGEGNTCKVNCAKLRDDDIADDVACAKKILKLQGLKAWSTYKYCKYPDSYLKGCF